MPNRTASEENSKRTQRGRSLEYLTLFVLAMWIVEVLSLCFPALALQQHGIHPRERDGLTGIAFAPFLHFDLLHLAANTIPLAILGFLIILRGDRAWLKVTLIGMVLGGAGVWLTGKPQTNHIGASGVVFAYLGFLLFGVYWHFTLLVCLLGIIAAWLYGSLLLGMLPGPAGISWEGHLSGFFAGIVAAWAIGGSKQSGKKN